MPRKRLSSNILVRRKRFRKRLLLGFVLGSVLFAVFVYVLLPGFTVGWILERGTFRKKVDSKPAAWGLEHEPVTFRAADGTLLSGWWIDREVGKSPPERAGTVALTHGIYENRDQVLDRARFLVRDGFAVLVFDLRGHGESGEAALTGGVKEALDFSAAADWLKETGRLKRPLIYFGLSLGAMAALRAGISGEADLVIAESPLPGVGEYLAERSPALFFVGLPGFLEACLARYEARTGIRLTREDLDLRKTVERLEAPVLILAASGDDLVEPEDLREMFEAVGSRKKRLFFLPVEGHRGVYQDYPMLYERAVREFLRDVRHPPQEEKK